MNTLRFCELPEEPGKIITAIEGYTNVPLVTLEKAVESLVPIVSEIKRMVWTVKQNCQHPPNSLSSDESGAIMLYTLEWQPQENSFYRILNKALRNENQTRLKPWFLYLKLIMTALSRIPSERRNIHRGMKLDVCHDYPQGRTFVWRGFSSCTASIHVLENEAFLGKVGKRTLFIIDCHSGKDIHQHSMVKTEDEVLLPAACQFKVLSSMNVGNGLSIIQIEELTVKAHEPTSYRNELLEQTIRQCQSHTLDLSGQQLNDQDMNTVAREGILKKRSIPLDILQHHIAQPSDAYLKGLILSHNSISNDGVRILAVAMNSSTLTSVDLEDNDISDVGATYLAQMLAENTTLLCLSLSQNQIGDAGMKLLANALAHRNTCLQYLNLSANTEISDESIGSITAMMEDNRSLVKLDLRHNHLTKGGERELRTAAKSKRSFELWLSHTL